jgi:radical SAM-linked protein
MAERVTIVFRKDGGARYLSHLDLLATLEFSIRRARLPVALSEGFNPRPRMALAAPLPLGHIGEREILELTLTRSLEPNDIQTRLAASVPAGIEILSVDEAEPGVRSAASRVQSVVYRIDLATTVDDLLERVADLMAQDRMEIEEVRDGATRKRDLRPFLIALEVSGGRALRATLRLAGDGTVRPEQILEHLSVPADGAQFRRESIELA